MQQYFNGMTDALSLSRVAGVSVGLFVAEPQGGVSLIRSLPIDDNQIVRAAKELIAEHGDAAIGVADQRISVCKCEDLNSVAKTWHLIREVIRDIRESDAKRGHA